MTTQIAPGNPSLDDCSKKLVEILKLVVADSERYSMKPPSDVTEKILKEIDFHFVDLGYMMVTFQRLWLDSRSSGSDAIAPSEKMTDRIDIRLMNTGKLDLEQLRKIMMRLNKAEDISNGLDRIYYHLVHYRNLCAARDLQDQVRHSNQFINEVLSQARSGVNRDIASLQSQVSRTSLYHDSLMKGKTFRIASISLLVSTLSFLVAIISFVLRNEGSLISSAMSQGLVLIVAIVTLAFAIILVAEWLQR